MKRILLAVSVILLILAFAGCRSSAEEGQVSVEVNTGKIVQVHPPGELWSSFGVYTTEVKVDVRNHTDHVDIEGVTKDNIPFTMKVSVIWQPIAGKVPEYLRAFGFDHDERESRRNNVTRQLVQNAARDATSGRYDAYALRANQADILAAIKTELDKTFPNELFATVQSVGMEEQPHFADPKIDEAANAVVAAQKQKEAEEQLLQAARINIEKQKVQNEVYSDPRALEIKKLELQLQITQALAQGIGAHNGTLIIGSLPAQSQQLQLQQPLGGK